MSLANYITLLKLTKQRQPIQMMCYKDRTWCSHSLLCSNISCDRNFTEEERENAIKWWSAISDNCGGKDFPIALADFKTDDCGFISKEINDGELTDET